MFRLVDDDHHVQDECDQWSKHIGLENFIFEMRTDKYDSDTGSGRDGKVEKKGKVVNILGNIALIFSP